MRNLALGLVWLATPWVAGCGKVKDDTVVDAPKVSIDAPIPVDAATHGTVNVTTLDFLNNDAPVAGIDVIIYKPDGTVATELASDANGKASGEVEAGASLTAYYPSANRIEVLTIQDVHPGDDLVFGLGNRDNTADGTFSVTFPSYPGATSYTVYGPCNRTSGTANVATNLDFYKNCKPDVFDVYVVASGSSGEMASAEKLSVMRTAGSAAIPNVWIPTAYFSVGYTNLTPEIASLNFIRSAGNPGGDSGAVSVNPMTAQGGTISNVVRAGHYAYAQTSFNQMPAAAGAQEQQIIGQRIDGKAVGYQLDVDGTRLPWVGNVAYDISTRTITSKLDRAGTFGEALSVLEFQSMIDTTNVSCEYIVMGPKSDRVVFPMLPAHLNAPQPVSTASYQAGIYLLDSTEHPTWDSVRPSPLDLLLEVEGGGNISNTARASIGVVSIPAM